VGKAAAVFSLAAGENTHHSFRAISQGAAVVPMEDAGSGDEKAFALRLLGGVGPLAGDTDHKVPVDPGLLFLPGRRIGPGRVVVVLWISGTGEAAVHPVVS